MTETKEPVKISLLVPAEHVDVLRKRAEEVDRPLSWELRRVIRESVEAEAVQPAA